jgi:uncharacterized protein (TIGR03032 family)
VGKPAGQLGFLKRACTSFAEKNVGTSSGSPSDQTAPSLREVRFEYSREFPRVLEHLNAALLVSTYQAGKLAVVGTHQGGLTFAFHSFDRAMGVAAGPQRIAVGTRRQVFLLRPEHSLAGHVEPKGTHDACWLTRSSLVTGNVHGHELAWGADGLWLVNTLFSCLCTLDDSYSFVPRWRPPFITELASQDRCHLNGLAMQDGRPRFVTAHAESNEPAGWRPIKATSGCIIDVPTGETIVRGLCMPHSPRWHHDRLWALDSGTGRLILIDPTTGQVHTVATFPGYTRGLATEGRFALVGLSKIRETSVFGGIPIAEHREALRCGVAAVDLATGQTVGWLQFHSGVDEVFAVSVLPGCRNPVFSGPSSEDDERQEIWVVPPERGVSASPTPQPAVPQLAAEASLLHRQGRVFEALERLKRAVEAAPDRADLLNDLGNLYQDLGDQDAAMGCYRRALAARPDLVAAHQNLGYLLFNYGEPDEALAHYAEASRLAPSPINRLLSAMVLPVIYDSAEEVERWRKRFADEVERLVQEGVQIDTTRTLVPTDFFLAYHGRNDRDLVRNLGRIYRGVDLCPASVRRSQGGRIKVGFLSAYFRDHTLGRLNLGRIQHLDRSRFEVTVIYLGRQEDAMTRAFAQAADRFVVVPRDVEAARRQIAELGLDVLVFTEVGMDAVSYTLAFSRMAPIQCSTWGHPETSGSPRMDYFISSQWMETAESDAHYTERLVRLPNLGTYYYRPQLTEPRRSREFFGLDPKRHLYICPQTLFKFHPDFDAVLAGILQADPEAELALLEGRVPNWTARLKRRLARTLGDHLAPVRFLPAQPNPEYLQLLAAADVMLDPYPYGGGNTSYEALAVGTPLVTWPSDLARGRITLALCHKMGWTDCVVASAEQYIELAVRLGTDEAYRESIRARIRATSGRLFEDLEEVHALESFLVEATAR